MDRNKIWVHAEAPTERTLTPGSHGSAGKPFFCVFLYKRVMGIHLLLWDHIWTGGYTVTVCDRNKNDLIFYLHFCDHSVVIKGLWINSYVNVTKIVHWISIVCSSILETASNQQLTIWINEISLDMRSVLVEYLSMELILLHIPRNKGKISSCLLLHWQ
jgi:hypothetical protein